MRKRILCFFMALTVFNGILSLPVVAVAEKTEETNNETLDWSRELSSLIDQNRTYVMEDILHIVPESQLTEGIRG